MIFRARFRNDWLRSVTSPEVLSALIFSSYEAGMVSRYMRTPITGRLRGPLTHAYNGRQNTSRKSALRRMIPSRKKVWMFMGFCCSSTPLRPPNVDLIVSFWSSGQRRTITVVVAVSSSYLAQIHNLLQWSMALQGSNMASASSVDRTTAVHQNSTGNELVFCDLGGEKTKKERKSKLTVMTHFSSLLYNTIRCVLSGEEHSETRRYIEGCKDILKY